MTLLATLMLVLAVEPEVAVTSNAQPPSAAARVAVTAAAGLGTAVVLVGASAGIGLLLPCSSDFACRLYALTGALVVGGLAALIAVPLVDFVVARAMGGQGARWTSVAGWVVGLLASGALGFGTMVVGALTGATLVTVVGVGLSGLALFLAPAIALELSHADTIKVTPTVAPVTGGAVVGVALAF